MAATARFASVVKTAGRPRMVTLWSDPKKDPGFREALREDRVMTVRQENVGNKADAGQVGFFPERNAVFLVFPSSLKAFANQKIIGIKYNLLEEEKPADPVTVLPRRRRRPSAEEATSPSPARLEPRSRSTAKAKSTRRRFQVRVRYQAEWETTHSVTAASSSEAEEKVLARLKARAARPPQDKVDLEVVEAAAQQS